MSPFGSLVCPYGVWSCLVQPREHNSVRGNIAKVVVGKISLFSVPGAFMITRPAADESASMPGCFSTGSQSSRDEVMGHFPKELLMLTMLEC